MRYVLGIDGGQTSTTAVMADETGRLLGAGFGGPANHINEPGGRERVRQSLTDAIAGARAASGLPAAKIAYAYLGMTGGSPEMEAICRPAVPAEEMELGHDSEIALYAVTGGAPGVVVIAGTGSVAFGRNAAGESALAGGWGYLLGDEGSGYWIGLRALNECLRSEDGRKAPTKMLEPILAQLRARDMREVHRRVYSGGIGRTEIAALAPIVSASISRGDWAAQSIIRDAGAELGELVIAVAVELGMTAPKLEVGCVGGVFRAGEQVMASLTGTMQRVLPRARLIPPSIPSVIAAVLLAIKAIGSVDASVRSNVYASLDQLGPLKD